MKTAKACLFLLISCGILATADAQYYYGPPSGSGPPPPPPQGYRHHQERQESKEDNGSSPTGYFGLSIGIATPVGNFANEFGGTNTNYTNAPPNVNFPGGYAQSGLNFNVSLGIPVNHSNFGIAFQYAGAANYFDIGTYSDNMAFDDQNKTYDGGDIQSFYNSSFIMAGLFATIPVQRLSFDFKLMGGIALCSTPEIAYSAQQQDGVVANQTDNYSWDISPSNSASLALGLGADLRYKLRRSSIMFGVDFLSTTVNVNSQEVYTYSTTNTVTGMNSYNTNSYTHVGGIVPVSMVNAYIGIAYDIR